VDATTARKRLEETRDELDKSIMVLQGDQPLEDRATDFPDPADAGSNLSETERVEAVLTVAKQQLAEVLDALHRIEEGGYGNCADCGKPVPEGRLEAKPEAARCVACQGKRDRQRR
jgi:RNA polymerase-binding transcription factor DksA